jgi:hypothetical protein
VTDDPPATWTEPCGDTEPVAELARIQQIAYQLRDPHFGARPVETVTSEEYLCAPPDSPPSTQP